MSLRAGSAQTLGLVVHKRGEVQVCFVYGQTGTRVCVHEPICVCTHVRACVRGEQGQIQGKISVKAHMETGSLHFLLLKVLWTLLSLSRLFEQIEERRWKSSTCRHVRSLFPPFVNPAGH